MPADTVLELVDVRKDYPGAVVTRVLHGITFTVRAGEFTAIVGPSGSGKSTLLNVIGLLDRPSSGVVRVAGEDTTTMDEAGRTRLRSRALGFVFQFHHLVTSLTAVENVMMPLAIQRGRTDPEDRARALAVLAEVGLDHRAKDRIQILSGGQQQRVAIARALAHAPRIVLADEPTGNLDTEHSDEAFALMRRFNQERGTAFVVVTHDPRLAARCDRVIQIVDGRIAGDGPPR